VVEDVCLIRMERLTCDGSFKSLNTFLVFLKSVEGQAQPIKDLGIRLVNLQGSCKIAY
jgi:hypothetical protein